MSAPAVLFSHAGTLPSVPPAAPAAAPNGPAVVAAALAAASDRWLDRVRYRPLSRWTQLLEAADAALLLHPDLHADLAHVEIWVLSWLTGQGTPLHDHGRSAGAFAVVRGELTESVVAAGRPGGVDHRLTEGRVRQFGPHYMHRVANTAAGPAVSVHVYAPALSRMNTYAVAGGRIVRTGTEKAGVDW